MKGEKQKGRSSLPIHERNVNTFLWTDHPDYFSLRWDRPNNYRDGGCSTF